MLLCVLAAGALGASSSGGEDTALDPLTDLLGLEPDPLAGTGLIVDESAEPEPDEEPLGGLSWAEIEAMLAEEAFSPWSLDTNTALSGGYASNILRSAVNRQSGPVAQAEADASLVYLSEDTWTEFFASAFVDYRYYPGSDDLDETLVFLSSRFTRDDRLGHGYGLTATYFYIDEFFDLSTAGIELDAVRVRLHQASLEPFYRRYLGEDWTVGASIKGSRLYFETSDDHYWEGGGSLSLTRALGQAWEASLEYSYYRKDFDERTARTGSGFSTSEPLTYDDQRLRLRVEWNQRAGDWEWWLRTDFGFRRREDSLAGYNDYDLPEFGQRLQIEWRRWRWEAEWEWQEYRFPVQTADGPGSPLVRRDSLELGSRLQYRVSDDWTLRLRFQFEDQNSTRSDESYSTFRVTFGLNWLLPLF